MSEDINLIRTELWAKMRTKGKPYRDAFVTAHLSTNIAAQIQTMREKEGWTQEQLAEKTGMSQARISVMENPSYDKYSLKTLRRLGSAFDVAVIVRFEAFSSLVNWVANLSPEKMAVPKFDDDSLIKPEQTSAFLPSSRNADTQKKQATGLEDILMGRSFGSSPFQSREQYDRYQQADSQLGFAR
jgi:transcriptional regulator with XRE-family HTH domain